ncbi:hypothetical protein LCGC14_0694460 [marine sediment metagenome]|uniref:Uncharacterized protein n=1 Tax=marine sediment metagenome TaxID=412755 RepID=A0A0F9QPK6_9ZZZZ
MAYEKDKDKVLFEKTADCGMFNIIVAVYSYNEGEKKVQISRQRLQDKGEPQFAKLGRMSLGELDEVMPLVKEAMDFIKGEDKKV